MSNGENGTRLKSNSDSVTLSGDFSVYRKSKLKMSPIRSPSTTGLQNPKPEKQPNDKRVSVDEYLQDSFKLPDESKKSSKNTPTEEVKEVDEFLQNALKVARKLEGREIVSFDNNSQSKEKIEEELEKIRMSLGIKVKSKNTPSTQQMMPTPSAASSS